MDELNKLLKNPRDILFVLLALLGMSWIFSQNVMCVVPIAHLIDIIRDYKESDTKKGNFDFYSKATLFYLIAYIICCNNESYFWVGILYFVGVNFTIISKGVSYNKYFMIGSAIITIIWILVSFSFKKIIPYYEYVLIEYLIMQLKETLNNKTLT